MKRLFYLINQPELARQALVVLRNQGVALRHLHAVGRNARGLREQGLPMASAWQTRDVIRQAERGALAGLLLGGFAAAVMHAVLPYAALANSWAMAVPVVLFTLFGAWEGATVGWRHESAQLQPFLKDIEQGHCVLMVDVSANRTLDIEAALKALGLGRPARVASNWVLPFERLAA